jgi:hypothetical protein
VITFEGHHTTQRTVDMLREARRLTGLPLVITQGGYNAGAVPDSAGTHDRDALDVRAKDLAQVQVVRAVTALRQVGFAAWYRTVAQGFKVAHIHAIPIGGDISAGAADQVTAYKNGRNGLKGNGKDDGPKVAYTTWAQYLKAHPQDEETEMTPEQLQAVLDNQRRGDDKYEIQATAWRQAGELYAKKLFDEGKSPTEVKDLLFAFYRPLWSS